MILFIYCGGGLGLEVLFAAQRQNKVCGKYTDICFLDDTMDGRPIHHTRSRTYETLQQQDCRDTCQIVVANGEPFFRERIYRKIIGDGYAPATVIDPLASVSEDAIVHPGFVALAGACVSPLATIEENVLLYYHAVVSHHAHVGAGSLLSSGCVVSGHCTIGRRVFVGSNASVRQDIRVGDDSIIGMGSAIVKDVLPSSVMSGVPGVVLRKNTDQRVFNM